MSKFDRRDCAITGATAAALDAYERALSTSLSWRSGAANLLDTALHESPMFVSAHIMQAWLLLSTRDRTRVRLARPVLERAMQLPANERERMHLGAIAALLDDDFERTKQRLGEVLDLYPRDVLALQAAHAFDYLTGEVNSLRDRVQSVLPAWSKELPNYHAVLAMYAFGLEECGEFGRAEQTVGVALALNPADARAHHVMAHVFEMTERADAGLRWMTGHLARWSIDTAVATHCWWHVALFHLAQGSVESALHVYDRHVRNGRSRELADLIDAAALLWRVAMLGGRAGTRWAELADAWAPHIEDTFCSFSDFHAMLAFVGARDWDRSQRLERVLVGSAALATRHGATTRQLGLPASRALIAFGRGDDALAIALLRNLPAIAHRLGGSHAQRDVLHLTMQRAIERARQPSRRPRMASLAIVSRR